MYALTPHFHLFRAPRRILPCRTLAALYSPPSSSHAAAASSDTSLRSTWPHRAWVAAGCATVLSSLTNAITTAAESGEVIEPVLAALLGYVLADLGTGVYHWAIDNYGGASTPVFGTQIEAFQGHHRRPWTITRREPANNLHALARAIALVAAPLDLAAGDHPAAHAFVAIGAFCVMFSQQFHAWAHTQRSRLPPAVAALQEAGVLISRKMHARHHRPPYNNNYCIVSGAWNETLDRFRVFEAMEMVIFFRFRVRPRSWSEPALEWKEEEEEEEEEELDHLVTKSM